MSENEENIPSKVDEIKDKASDLWAYLCEVGSTLKQKLQSLGSSINDLYQMIKDKYLQKKAKRTQAKYDKLFYRKPRKRNLIARKVRGFFKGIKKGITEVFEKIEKEFQAERETAEQLKKINEEIPTRTLEELHTPEDSSTGTNVDISKVSTTEVE